MPKLLSDLFGMGAIRRIARQYGTAGLAALLCVGVLVGCDRYEGVSPVEDASDEPLPEQVSHEAEFFIHQGDRPRAVLQAQVMENYSYNDTTYTVFTRETEESNRRVTVQLFDAEGDSSAVLTSDRLVYLEDEARFDAYGDVVVETADDRHLESEELSWHEDDQTIRTSAFVYIRTPSEEVEGWGLVADEDLASYQIGRFEAQVEMNDNGNRERPERPESPDER